jgi:arginase
MRDIDERGLKPVMMDAIRFATDDTAGFHLSLDMDSVDPQQAPGVGNAGAGRAHLSRSAFGHGDGGAIRGLMLSLDVVEV